MSHLNQTLNSITKEIKKMEIKEVNSEMISRLTHMINKINKIQIKLLSLDKENYSSLNQVVGAIQNIIRKEELTMFKTLKKWASGVVKQVKSLVKKVVELYEMGLS